MTAALLALALSIGSALAVADQPPAAAPREAEVRERSADVMPFSMAATLHVFDKTATGGVQKVEAREGSQDQIPLIRAHLRSIAEAFARRDFSGPAHIHGENMPGLAALRAAPAAALTVHYRELPDGAEVRYDAATPALVEALHQWFDAQLSDHGHDAMSHHHSGSAP